ncbi:MAG: acetate--CoA ligase [Armatimonadetes bacterium]|nr:acetate--CoA ligase [Armatimonadota bacterium]MDW8122966.1 acetate--CoA ligase [Armatimonadota bacterium]
MEVATVQSLLSQERVIKPPESFRQQANIRDPGIYDEAAADPAGFWARVAQQMVSWFRPWDKVLEYTPPSPGTQPPWIKWFIGGQLNACYNCVDRHTTTWRRTKAAIIWEGEPGDERVLTYQDLHRDVQKFANILKSFGVRKGDRVTIYMPMVPELAIAVLACARIGAVHSVVFGGFSAEALRDRILDSGSRLLITADGGWRRGNIVPLKRNADDALRECPDVTDVIVFHRGVLDATMVPMKEGRDHWWHRMMEKAPLDCPCEVMDSEDPLFILYTSGTTGKPKGQLHTTGGYLVGVTATHRWIFDIKDEDIYWCTADIGWVTGHSYIVYGPLSNGATVVMYEGAPDFPDRDRWWALIEKYRVNILYTTPTAIRTFMKWGESYPQRHDMSSLRLLGTVGEPINPEAWIWYYETIGGSRCPVVDTWWQTETGSILISPLPGITDLKPGSATRPFPGIFAEVVDEKGNPCPPGVQGYLVLTKPYPSMSRTIWGDPDRYVQTYWSRYPGWYFTGDAAVKDQDGYFWLLGRVDDVMNVSGHRISTMELESVLVEHPWVAEAAVIGRSDDVKGQVPVAFVTLREDAGEGGPKAVDELKQYVVRRIGAIARPADIFFTAELPKTRSGKIMRRLLRDIAEGRVLGDTTTLADPTVVQNLRQVYEERYGEGS